jgi:hypothetical protein
LGELSIALQLASEPPIAVSVGGLNDEVVMQGCRMKQGEEPGGKAVDGASRLDQFGMEWVGIYEGPVSGSFNVEGVASGVTDEGGSDESCSAESSLAWFWDEEVRDMPAIVEETMRVAATNPCAMFHWYSCWL